MSRLWNFRRDMCDLSDHPRAGAFAIDAVVVNDDAYLVRNPCWRNTEYSESFRVAVHRIVCTCGKRLPVVRARKE